MQRVKQEEVKIREHSHLFIQNSHDAHVAGCYLLEQHPHQVRTKYRTLIPLKSIDYQIKIVQNMAKIAMRQEYFNPTDSILEIQYNFPSIDTVCIYNFVATFDQNQLIGMIKEKNQAMGMYKSGLEKGRKVAHGAIEKTSNILHIKLGNISAKSSVVIKIEYLQFLTVSANKLWTLQILKQLSPRVFYMMKEAPIETFKLNLVSRKELTFYNSNTHTLTEIANIDNKEVVLVLQKPDNISKNFLFHYATFDHHIPNYVIGQNDTNKTIQISFIPQFHDLSIDDTYNLVIKNDNQAISDISFCRGEFIFMLDRSGSMRDNRKMENAKEALKFFIKSLPQDSYYNIISFGTNYKKMYEQRIRYAEDNVIDSLKKVAKMDADMGCTYAFQAILQILKSKGLSGYPKFIYLLTDGDIEEGAQILKAIKKFATGATQMNTIGVGKDVSKEYLMNLAKLGGGKSIFIERDSSGKEIAKSVIQILKETVSPVISEILFECQENGIMASVLPNPLQIPDVLKNKPVTISVIMKHGIVGKKNFKISYRDSKGIKQEIKLEIDLNEKGEDHIYKLAHYKRLRLLLQILENGRELNNDIYLQQVKDLKNFIIEESVMQQILTPFTSYVAVGKELMDHELENFKNTNKIKLSGEGKEGEKHIQILDYQSNEIEQQVPQNYYMLPPPPINIPPSIISLPPPPLSVSLPSLPMKEPTIPDLNLKEVTLPKLENVPLKTFSPPPPLNYFINLNSNDIQIPPPPPPGMNNNSLNSLLEQLKNPIPLARLKKIKTSQKLHNIDSQQQQDNINQPGDNKKISHMQLLQKKIKMRFKSLHNNKNFDDQQKMESQSKVLPNQQSTVNPVHFLSPQFSAFQNNQIKFPPLPSLGLMIPPPPPPPSNLTILPPPPLNLTILPPPSFIQNSNLGSPPLLSQIHSNNISEPPSLGLPLNSQFLQVESRYMPINKSFVIGSNSSKLEQISIVNTKNTENKIGELFMELQKINGSWEGTSQVFQLLQKIKVDIKELKRLSQLIGDLSLALTVIITQWMHKHCNNSQYELMLFKSNSWINQHHNFILSQVHLKESLLKLLI